MTGAGPFTQQFCAILKERLPSARASAVGTFVVEVTLADGRVLRADWSQHWPDCRSDPSGRAEAFGRIAQSIVDLEASRGIRTEAIVPLIRDEGFLERSLRNAPGGTKGIKSEHLAADLWIAYAEDAPNGWKYVPERHPMGLPELRQRAIEHLRAIHKGVKRQQHGDCVMLTDEQYLAASLLLLDEIWESEAGHVGGDLVAAVPTRYILLFTGSDSEQGMASLKAAARDAGAGGTDPLSQALLIRRGGRWEWYRELGA